MSLFSVRQLPLFSSSMSHHLSRQSPHESIVSACKSRTPAPSADLGLKKFLDSWLSPADAFIFSKATPALYAFINATSSSVP
jgi:hypothetical protein